MASAAWKKRIVELIEEDRFMRSKARFGPKPPSADAWRARVAEMIQSPLAARSGAPRAGVVGRVAGARAAPGAVPRVEVQPPPTAPAPPREPARTQVVDVEAKPIDTERGEYDGFHGTKFGFNESEGDFGDLETDLGLADR